MFYLGVLAIVVMAVAIICLYLYFKGNLNEKYKLGVFFLMGLCLMIISFLGGFTIGKIIAVLPCAVWAYMFKKYESTNVKIVSGAMFLITIIEVVYF